MDRAPTAPVARARRCWPARSSGSALGWLWFRDSSFAARRAGHDHRQQLVRAEPGARRARAGGADGMSTLHVDAQALQRRGQAVHLASPTCGSAPDFPHDLRIEVIEHAPVAAVETGGSRVPATGGGLAAHRRAAPDDLPTIVNKGPLADGRVQRQAHARRARRRRRRARRAARPRRAAVVRGDAASTLDLRDGPELIFGRRRRARTSGAPRRACSRSTRRPAPPTSTCACRSCVAAGGVGPDRRPRRRATPTGPTIRTLNHRVRMTPILDPWSRLWRICKRSCRGSTRFDIGKEIPVTCRNPRPCRARENARL